MPLLSPGFHQQGNSDKKVNVKTAEAPVHHTAVELPDLALAMVAAIERHATKVHRSSLVRDQPVISCIHCDMPPSCQLGR